MERAVGWSERGGGIVVTGGLSSTTQVQRSFTGATVTVYDAGTVNLATIYDDDNDPPTAKANPFTADATTGFWHFYAAPGSYDVTFSGGGISAPFTVQFNLGLGEAGGVPSFAFADLPTAKTQDAGNLARVTDVEGGLWMNSGIQWVKRGLINVRDAPFNARGDGVTDDTTALTNAIAAGGVYIPDGTYLVSNLDVLAAAGRMVIGESRWNTIIKVAAGTTGSIFNNPNSGSGTSAFHYIAELFIDLNAQNMTAIDLASINKSTIERVHFKGGAALGSATGTGVRFAAPLSAGSYSNSVRDCDFLWLAKGVFWDTGGNNNYVFGGEAVGCTVGYDTTPSSGTVDTPKIFGPRVEACATGLNEGAVYGMYFGIRFEGQTVTDINFSASSDHPQIFGGFTASSAAVLSNITNSDSPLIVSSDLGGYKQIEASQSRPIQQQGFYLFTAPGVSLPTKPSPMDANYVAYFFNRLLMRNNIPIHSLDSVGTGIVALLHADGSNVVNVGDAARALELKGTFVRPKDNGTTHLGQNIRRWQTAYIDVLRLLEGTSHVVVRAGTGSPEGVISADPGSLFLRTDGGAGTSLYVKESGTSSTGWVGK